MLQNLTGLNEEFEKRRTKYSQFGATVQPYVILVGQDLNVLFTLCMSNLMIIYGHLTVLSEL